MNRRNLTVGLIFASVLVLVLAWRVRKPPHVARAPETVRGSSSVATGRFDFQELLKSQQPRESQVDAARPIIDAVTVDKKEMCRGEENFVRIKARVTDGSDAFLGYRFRDPRTGIINLTGPVIPFTVDEPSHAPLRVLVQGKMATTSAQVPDVLVKDCLASRQVRIAVSRRVVAQDMVGLTAEVVEYPPDGQQRVDPLVPVSYDWEFGDGESTTTTSAHLTHSYEGRDQRTRQSAFIVAVTVKGRNGQTAHGTTSVGFVNQSFGPLMFQNRVVISVRVDEATATEHEKIWLYHGFNWPVAIDKVELVERQVTEGHARETLRRPYSPSEFLGVTKLSAHQSVRLRDLDEFRPEAAPRQRIVEVHGWTPDGKEARGAFTLLARKSAVAESTDSEGAEPGGFPRP